MSGNAAVAAAAETAPAASFKSGVFYRPNMAFSFHFLALSRDNLLFPFPRFFPFLSPYFFSPRLLVSSFVRPLSAVG